MVAVAVAVGAGVPALLLFLLLLWSVRRRRALVRRIEAVAVRLGTDGGGGAHDQEDSVARVERLAEAIMLQLSEAEARGDRLTGALDELAVAVVVWDEHGALVYRNDAAAELDETAARVVEESLRAALTTGERRARTVEVPGPARRALAIAGRPIDDGRRVVGAVTAAEDVSARRRVDVMRRDFVTNVTAELKAPVGALGLLAAAIVAEDDPGLTRRLAHRLQSDALRVGRVIDDLAELSRLDAQVVPVRDPVAVHLVVAQAIEEASGLALPRRIAVEVVEAPRHLAVVGDRRQLVSAVRHLVDNAVRYSDPGGAVEVSVAADDGFVAIAVSDGGPGVREDELDRIFECFYRVDATRARHPGGTGLGLAIASQVAAAHGGAITVASAEGEGSTFTLRLPRAAGEQPTPVPAGQHVVVGAAPDPH